MSRTRSMYRKLFPTVPHMPLTLGNVSQKSTQSAVDCENKKSLVSESVSEKNADQKNCKLQKKQKKLFWGADSRGVTAPPVSLQKNQTKSAKDI